MQRHTACGAWLMYLVCEFCGKSLEQGQRGRPAKFCSRNCKLGRTGIYECQQCGKSFEAYHKRKHCSAECREKNGRELQKVEKICEGCEVAFIGRDKRSKFCSSECANRTHNGCRKCHICLWCASVFTIKTRSSKNDGKYCSRQCRFDYLNWRTEVRAVQSDGDTWRVGGQCGDVRVCEACGKLYESTGANQKVCSDACAYEKFKERQRRCYEPKLTWKDCLYCGKMFCSSRRTCSKRCQRKNARANKSKGYEERCIKYGTHYDPSVKRLAIFKRDNWTCQLCGIKCRQDGQYLEEDAPELDHIMPISKGGDHVESNVWCLCRKCNAEKSDMILV